MRTSTSISPSAAAPVFALAATLVVALAMVVAIGLWSPGSADAARRFPVAPAPGSAYVPGQLLVELRAGASARDMAASVRELGATVVRVLPAPSDGSGRRIVLVRSDTLNTHALAAVFEGRPSVVRTSPNYYRRIDGLLPDDPGLVSQWGLQHIGAPQAWEVPPSATPVVVASIDTGVDFLHPDLAANMWHNPGEIPGNSIDDDGNGYVDDVYGIDPVDGDSSPMDDYGHGTHTSGIIAAVADNGIGVAGVGPNTQIMAIKFLDAGGWGTDAGAIESVDYVTHEKVDHGVNVVAINASWGWTHRSPLLREAVERAGDAGIVFCASAGNSGTNNDVQPHYPSSFPSDNVIAVAATGRSDRLTYWSCWGPRKVDLAAPGADILSTVLRMPQSSWWGDTETMYASWDGTSMAAPFVAGTVAACAGAFPAETMQQRIERIYASVDTSPDLRGRCTTGGRLDLGAALNEGSVSGDVTPPTTQVLGGDPRWHDVPVSLSLWKSDGLGGSGAAITRWRIDGGKWRFGTDVTVRAKRKTKVTHTIEYQSVDKAGNREPKKSLQVNIDTTATVDNDIPGVPLPASPAVGDVEYWFDPYDVYSVDLAAGESFTALAAGLPGVWPTLGIYPTGVAGIRGVSPLAQSRIEANGSALTYCAETAGTYFVDVAGSWPGSSYALTWKIHPAGVDVTPPFVTMKDTTVRGWFFDSERWSNQPVRLTFAADDGLMGSGVSSIETSTDEGVTWSPGAHPLIPAPADHSNDGVHTVYYRATDVAGNVSGVQSGLVAIDTTGPSTETWAPRKAVKRGSRCWIRTRIDEMTYAVIGELVIKSVATGDVVATKSGRWFSSGRDWTILKCDFPRGDYDVLVAGKTYDLAGNLWTSAVSHQMLRVR